MRNPDLLFFDAAFEELQRARGGNDNMHSAHEAIAVIQEEYLELRQEVFKKESLRQSRRMYDELLQLAAMACRMAVDLNLESGSNSG